MWTCRVSHRLLFPSRQLRSDFWSNSWSTCTCWGSAPRLRVSGTGNCRGIWTVTQNKSTKTDFFYKLIFSNKLFLRPHVQRRRRTAERSRWSNRSGRVYFDNSWERSSHVYREREKDELNTISLFNFFFFDDSTSLFVQSDSFRLKNLPFVHSRVFCCVLSFTVVKWLKCLTIERKQKQTGKKKSRWDQIETLTVNDSMYKSVDLVKAADNQEQLQGERI